LNKETNRKREKEITCPSEVYKMIVSSLFLCFTLHCRHETDHLRKEEQESYRKRVITPGYRRRS
jgi:hypothetical protein